MEIIQILLLITGAFFFLVGTVGLLRLPDVFSRMHATTKCDTLGAGLILMALVLNQGMGATSLKLVIILASIWLTNPAAAHIIARTTFKTMPQARQIFTSGENSKDGNP